MERCERSSGAGLGILETVCFIDDEDSPRETVEMRYGAPRGVERRDNYNVNTNLKKSWGDLGKYDTPTSSRPMAKSFKTRSRSLGVPMYAPTSK